MALPPKGDPTRPLFLAARSCSTIGGLLAIFVVIGGMVTLFSMGSRSSMVTTIVMALVFGFYGAICALFFVVAHFLRKQKMWAIIVGMVLGGLGMLLGLGNLLTLGYGLLAANAGASGLPGFLWVMLGISLLICAAFGQMIWHLIQGMKAIQADRPRGFEPIPIVPMAQMAQSQGPVPSPNELPGSAE